MSIHRWKANFTSGELSPLLDARIDNDRNKNGCKTLLNMHVKTQGPATRRSGFRFIYDISSLDIDATATPRLIPFIFDEDSAYILVFYKHTSGTTRVVFATGTGLVEDPSSPGDPYAFEFSGTLDIATFKSAQSADILYIAQPLRLPVEFKRLAHDSWSANEVAITVPPFIINKTDITIGSSGTTGSVTLTASADLFTSEWVGEKVKLNAGIVEITAYTDATHVTGTVETTLTAGTATKDWYAQEWSSRFGFPRFVGFYEQRLFYASTLTRPQTIWFSKSGDYYDFSTSTPIVESDAATFTLDSGSQNKFQWMVSARELIVGTLGDEWAISGSGYEPLSFSSIRANRHTNHGGEAIDPLMIGPVVLFIERLGRTVNQMVYDFNSDSYNTVDLSVLAPHLTDNHTITDWTYQQTPNSIVWAVRGDGYLLGLTFKREHNVTGWHRHNTQGQFLKVASIPGTKEDEVWALVKREVNSTDVYYLEKKAEEFLSDDVLDSYFLDSHLVYGGAAATTISGLEHLEGCTVDILGDGKVFSDYVVSSGSITLPIAVEKAVVGLSYSSEIVPKMPEYDLQSGTTFLVTRRTDHVSLLLYNSLGLRIGRYDSEDGEERDEEDIPFRRPGDDPNAAVPLFSGVKRLSVFSGHDRVSDIYIRQERPLPLTIVGLVDEVDIKER